MTKKGWKKWVLPVLAVFYLTGVFAQNETVLLKEAQNLELKFDEAGALEKYKQLSAKNPADINALIKCAELECSIGNRQKAKDAKLQNYEAAGNFAQQAYREDSLNAGACYVKALVATKMSETENDNKKLAEYIKVIKIFSDKSLAINPGYAKANYLLGKWHFELIHSGWLKKQSIKSFYNEIPDTQIDSAAYFMEKCRIIAPYYVQNYLDLAKVYDYDHQREKSIEVLEKLVKLPNRTFDDAALKEEGKKMLETMQ